MASSPQYVGTVVSPSVTISTANTNRDGTTGTYGTVLTAGSSGARVDVLHINATGTTTAGMIRLFSGTAIVAEIPVQAVTPSGTTPAWSYDVVFQNGLNLAASTVLKASTNNSESFVLTVTNGGNY